MPERTMSSRSKRLACLLALLLAAAAPVAVAGAPLDDALQHFEGSFRWDAPQRAHVFSNRPGLAALLEPSPEQRLAALAACIDDPRPARATLDGKAVSLGVMCYQALRLLAYVEKPDWPGHIGPLATPAERRAARAAWQAVLDDGAYALH
jgi:hypothetical protein